MNQFEIKRYCVYILVLCTLIHPSVSRHGPKSFVMTHKQSRNKIPVLVTVDFDGQTITSRSMSKLHEGFESISDFKQALTAHRLELNGKMSCFLEEAKDLKWSEEVDFLEKVKGRLIKELPATLFISNSSLSPNQKEAIGSQHIISFCEGLEIYTLHPPGVNDEPTNSRHKRAARGRGHQPVTQRFQGKVEAHVSPAEDGSTGPEAFAIASPNAAVAKVGGNSGYAHAKSHVTVESDYGHGRSIRTMSASSTFSSSRGSAVGVQGGSQVQPAHQGSLSQRKPVSAGYQNNQRTAQAIPATQGSFSQESHVTASTSSSLQSPSGTQGVFGSAAQASHDGATRSSSGSRRTYQWKVKHPNGYNVAHWYTGPVGSDNNAGTVEGPFESAPLNLNIPGSQEGSRTVISASASGGGNLQTIGVGISPTGSIAERAHMEANSFLATSGSQTHQATQSHHFVRPVHQGAAQVGTVSNLPQPGHTSSQAQHQVISSSHVSQQHRGSPSHGTTQPIEQHQSAPARPVQQFPNHGHQPHHPTNGQTTSHIQDTQDAQGWQPAVSSTGVLGQHQEQHYQPHPIRQQGVIQATQQAPAVGQTVYNHQPVPVQTQPEYVNQVAAQPHHQVSHPRQPQNPISQGSYASAIEAMAQHIVMNPEPIPIQPHIYPSYTAQPQAVVQPSQNIVPGYPDNGEGVPSHPPQLGIQPVTFDAPSPGHQSQMVHTQSQNFESSTDFAHQVVPVYQPGSNGIVSRPSQSIPQPALQQAVGHQPTSQGIHSMSRPVHQSIHQGTAVHQTGSNGIISRPSQVISEPSRQHIVVQQQTSQGHTSLGHPDHQPTQKDLEVHQTGSNGIISRPSQPIPQPVYQQTVVQQPISQGRTSMSHSVHQPMQQGFAVHQTGSNGIISRPSHSIPQPVHQQTIVQQQTSQGHASLAHPVHQPTQQGPGVQQPGSNGIISRPSHSIPQPAHQQTIVQQQTSQGHASLAHPVYQPTQQGPGVQQPGSNEIISRPMGHVSHTVQQETSMHQSGSSGVISTIPQPVQQGAPTQQAGTVSMSFQTAQQGVPVRQPGSNGMISRPVSPPRQPEQPGTLVHMGQTDINKPLVVPQPGRAVQDVRGEQHFQIITGRVETSEPGARVLQPGQTIPELPGLSVPQGFRGRVVPNEREIGVRTPTYQQAVTQSGTQHGFIQHQQVHVQQQPQQQHPEQQLVQSSATHLSQDEHIPSPQELVDAMSSDYEDAGTGRLPEDPCDSDNCGTAQIPVSQPAGLPTLHHSSRPSLNGPRGQRPGQPATVPKSTDSSQCVYPALVCKIVYLPNQSRKICIPPPCCNPC